MSTKRKWIKMVFKSESEYFTLLVKSKTQNSENQITQKKTERHERLIRTETIGSNI